MESTSQVSFRYPNSLSKSTWERLNHCSRMAESRYFSMVSILHCILTCGQILNGPTIRINDPNAVYSAGYTLDPFFTADDENPSIIAFSGVPMCVPRSANDPKCPQSNRLAGNDFFIPDVTKMVPFKVGDHLTFSGRKVGTEIICFEIVVENVQIRTRPTQSTFIRVEDAIIGVFTTNANAEVSWHIFSYAPKHVLNLSGFPNTDSRLDGRYSIHRLLFRCWCFSLHLRS
jgi:hypothetical protein